MAYNITYPTYCLVLLFIFGEGDIPGIADVQLALVLMHCFDMKVIMHASQFVDELFRFEGVRFGVFDIRHA